MKKSMKVALSFFVITSLSLGQDENKISDIVVPINAINLAKSCQEIPQDIKMNLQKGDTQYILNWFIQASQALEKKDKEKLGFLISAKNMFLQKRNFLDLKNSFENKQCMSSMDVIAESFRDFKIKIKSVLEETPQLVFTKKIDDLKAKVRRLEEAYNQKNRALLSLLNTKEKTVIALNNNLVIKK